MYLSNQQVACNCPRSTEPTNDRHTCVRCLSQNDLQQGRREQDARLLALVVTTTPPIRKSRGKGRASVPRWQRGS